MQRSIRHFTFLEHSGSLCWLLVPDGHSEVEMALAGGTRPQNTRHQVRALTPEGHCRKAEFHHNLAEFSMRVTAYWSGIVGPDWYFSNRVTEMDRHSQPSRSKLLLVILQRRAHELATRAHPRL